MTSMIPFNFALLGAAAISAASVAAALGFLAPLLILFSLWYARDTVAAGGAELPIFKTGNTELTGDRGPAVPPMHDLEADAARTA